MDDATSYVKNGDSKVGGEQLTVPLERVHMPGDFGISLDSYLQRNGCGRGYVEGEIRVPGDHGTL